MARRIACVVEGHGDVEAVPVVVRRIGSRSHPNVVLQVSVPVRQPKSRLIKPGELERAVELAARRIGRIGAVLVVIDSDDDCPAQLGPTLLRRASGAVHGVPIAVAIAKREMEAWFIASVESLAGLVGLPNDLVAPAEPENIRGAKEWLTQRMAGNRSYSPTLDQPVLAREFDLDRALGADSFDKFRRVVEWLIEQSHDAG